MYEKWVDCLCQNPYLQLIDKGKSAYKKKKNNMDMIIPNSVIDVPRNEHPKVSIFENWYATEPYKTVSLWNFLLTDFFADKVNDYRNCRDAAKKAHIKESMNCVTVSGVFDTRGKKRLTRRAEYAAT